MACCNATASTTPIGLPKRATKLPSSSSSSTSASAHPYQTIPSTTAPIPSTHPKANWKPPITKPTLPSAKSFNSLQPDLAQKMLKYFSLSSLPLVSNRVVCLAGRSFCISDWTLEPQVSNPAQYCHCECRILLGRSFVAALET